jgi:hypothetical protein
MRDGLHTQVCMCLFVCMPSACFCESRVIRAALAVHNTGEREIYLPRLFSTELLCSSLKCNARSLSDVFIIHQRTPQNHSRYTQIH